MYLLCDLITVIHDHAWQRIILLFPPLCPLPLYLLLAAIYVGALRGTDVLSGTETSSLTFEFQNGLLKSTVKTG